jgi:hypothetical protein
MTSNDISSKRRAPVGPAGGGLGLVGLMSFVGALVYFWGAASSFGGVVLGFFKALVWPAFLVYGLLGATLG